MLKNQMQDNFHNYRLIENEQTKARLNRLGTCPYRRASRQRDIEFKINKRNLNQNQISFNYGNILNLYKFVPKKKYTEEFLNTDESDASTLSHDDSSDDDESNTQTTDVASITEGIATLLDSVPEPVTQPDLVECNFCHHLYKQRGLPRHLNYCKENPNRKK